MMASSRNHDPVHPRRRFRSWSKWLLLAVAVVFGMIILVPRRVVDVVAIDSLHRWQSGEAPPQRAILWQPAERVAPPADTAEVRDSLIRPQLDEHGTVLYFTLRKADGQADLYRTHLVERQWQQAEPVTELNSPADDIGPVISHDGQSLFLYSDRDGGAGGFDLYVSQRTKTGWTAPVNLGPRVNSPAHEYDPAISPDGLRLFFSSNRSPRMQRLITEHDGSLPEEHWRTTLRADLGLSKFDLYASSRAKDDAAWSLASPLGALNLPESNEGSPYIAANGAFLYFVSDRPTSHASETNFDIYRARLRGESLGAAENLGTGVNSAANELEPALSEEGFRLYFSRSRDDPKKVELYDLYASNASEIEEDTRWEASLAQQWLTGLFRFWQHNWWWLLSALLFIAMLLALLWFARRISWRRASVPGFLLIALLIHLLAGAGTFFVYFKDDIVATIKRDFDEVVVATEVNILDSSQPQAQAKPEFDQVADIAPPLPQQTSNVPRQAVQSPDMPARNSPTAPRIVARIEPENLPTKLATPPPAPTAPQSAPQLQRQTASASSLAQSAPLEELTSPQAAAQIQPEATTVDVERTEATPIAPAALPALPRRSVASELARDASPVERVATSSDPAPQEQIEAPLTKSRISSTTAAEPIAAALLPRVASSTSSQSLPATDVTLTRAAVPTDSAVPTVESAPSQPRIAAESITRAPALVPTMAPGSNSTANPLTRRVPRPEDSSLSAELVAPAPTVAGTGPSNEALPSAPNIVVDRLTNAAMSPTSKLAPEVRNSTPSAPQTVALPRVAASASLPASVSAANPLDKRSVSNTSRMSEQAEQLGLAKLAMTTSAESVDSEVLPSQDVSLARSSAKNSAPRLPDNPLAPASRSNTSSPSSPQLDRIADVTLPPIAPAASTAIPRASPTITDQTPVPAAVPLANATRTQSPYQAIAMGIEVSAARVDSPPANANIPAGPLAGNPSNNARLELPTLNRQTLDTTQLPTSALAGLQRASRGDHLAFAEGNIRLQTLLRLRKADDTAKRNLLQKFGASDETLVAIERGLNWIELHQHDDGHWSLNKFGECCSRHEGGKCAGHGGVNSDTAATGLALLPFLGDGHTHLTGKHQAAVAKGLQWLVTHQRRDSDPRKDGDLFTGNKGDNAYLYSHGIATIALCEAYAMSGDDALRDPAQRAVNFIVHAQHRDSGGWRYHPNQAADTSVVGWQVMALKSAQMANLHVPEGVLDLARKWLDSVAGKNDQLGRFAYQGGAYSPTMTAEALLCREYLGAQRDDADLQGGQRYLLAHLPQQGKESSYYWYYGTQFMFHMQGDGWKKWNGAINPLLLGSQVKEGSLAGTWKPKDQWENSGGTIYATSLRLLMLEVYYRHLPLYRTLDE